MMRIAVVAGALTLWGLSATPLYTVVDLGSFGGSDAVAYAVNGSGEAAGWLSAGPDPQAIAFSSAGAPTTLTMGGNAVDATATGINDAGWIAGTVYVGGTSHGVVWTPGGLIDLGPGTYAAAVNDRGQVAGNGTGAFLYANGSRTALGNLKGSTWSVAEGLSQTGEVAGYAGTAMGIEAFVWGPGGMTALGTLGGADSYAFSVNDSGTVVGDSTTSAGYSHAFLWSAGAMDDLGTLGGSSSYGYGLNDAGIAVGYSWLADNTDTHAWILLNGVMTDLNTLIAASPGWELTAAYGINDAGQIVGSGVFRGEPHAFLLDPLSETDAKPVFTSVPEPSDWIMLLSGVGLLLAGRFGIRGGV